MNWIVLETYTFYLDAQLAKSKLESEGIHCMLIDENIVSLDPAQSIALGGIKLKVLANEQQHASDILASCKATKPTNEKGEEILCPNCQSNDIDSKYKSVKSLKGYLALFFSFLTTSYPIYYKIKYKCNSCQNIFSKNK